MHGALESVAVLWRLRSYRDIIIIIIIMPTRDKFPGFGRTFKEIPGPESGIAPGTRAPLLSPTEAVQVNNIFVADIPTCRHFIFIPFY